MIGPLVAVAFAMLCLVTGYAGTPQPTSVNVNGVSIPAQLDQAQLKSWILQYPGQYDQAFVNGPPGRIAQFGQPPSNVPVSGAAQIRRVVDRDIATIYGDYISQENGQLNPAVNEMVKIGLWLELDVGIGFLVGLGLGALLGQRTVSTVLMIVLQIIVTPILAATVIPYFITASDWSSALPWTSFGPRAWRGAAPAARGAGGSAGRVGANYRRCPPGPISPAPLARMRAGLWVARGGCHHPPPEPPRAARLLPLPQH